MLVSYPNTLMPKGLSECFLVSYPNTLMSKGFSECLLVSYPNTLMPKGFNECLLVSYPNTLMPKGFSECLLGCCAGGHIPEATTLGQLWEPPRTGGSWSHPWESDQAYPTIRATKDAEKTALHMSGSGATSWSQEPFSGSHFQEPPPRRCHREPPQIGGSRCRLLGAWSRF